MPLDLYFFIKMVTKLKREVPKNVTSELLEHFHTLIHWTFIFIKMVTKLKREVPKNVTSELSHILDPLDLHF